MSGRMQGKICLVTGATAGIGKATALGLARLDARVVIVGRDAGLTEETVNELRRESRNSQVESLVADLSSQAEGRRLAATFQQRYDRLDGRNRPEPLRRRRSRRLGRASRANHDRRAVGRVCAPCRRPCGVNGFRRTAVAGLRRRTPVAWRPSSLPALGRPLSTVAGQARGNRSGTSSPPSAVYGWRATVDHARRVTSSRCPSSSLPQRDRIVVRVVRSRTQSPAAG